MKQFLKDLISDSSIVSSKRFISLFGAIFLFAATILNFFGVIIQSEIIYALVRVIIGSNALTIFQPKNNIPVLNSIIDSPDNPIG